MLALKVNPAHFKSPYDILKYLPNINTMVVSKFESLNETITLPDTVTSIVAKCVGFGHLTESTIRYADRVVEIGEWRFTQTHPADLSLFPQLETIRSFVEFSHRTLPRTPSS